MTEAIVCTIYIYHCTCICGEFCSWYFPAHKKPSRPKRGTRHHATVHGKPYVHRFTCDTILLGFFTKKWVAVESLLIFCLHKTQNHRTWVTKNSPTSNPITNCLTPQKTYNLIYYCVDLEFVHVCTSLLLILPPPRPVQNLFQTFQMNISYLDLL